MDDNTTARMLSITVEQMVAEVAPHLKCMCLIETDDTLLVGCNVKTARDRYGMLEIAMIDVMRGLKKELGIECDKEFANFMISERKKKTAQHGKG